MTQMQNDELDRQVPVHEIISFKKLYRMLQGGHGPWRVLGLGFVVVVGSGGGGGGGGGSFGVFFFKLLQDSKKYRSFQSGAVNQLVDRPGELVQNPS